MILLALLACMPDDYDGTGLVVDSATDDPGTPYTSSQDTAQPESKPPVLFGDWRSEGDDLAPLLADPPFSYRHIDATFDTDGTYAVTSTDSTGTAYPLSGTYTVGTTTSPGTIALVQVSPYAAEANGIWQVDGDVLTYEVVQTLPDYGFAPPTPSSGFGSTSGPGMQAGANIQVYRRR